MTGTAVYGTVRTVVWEDGGGNPASYPILMTLRGEQLSRRYVALHSSHFSDVQTGTHNLCVPVSDC